MSKDAKKAAASRSAGRDRRSIACSTRLWKKGAWRAIPNPSARQGPGEGVRFAVPRRVHDALAGFGGDDQRAHRADRSPDLRCSSTRSCTTRRSRSWKPPGAACSTWWTRPRPARMLKIKVFNARRRTCCATCSAPPSSTRARMFKKVYEEEFGIFGGAPFGALIGDYEFGKHPRTWNCWRRSRTWPRPRTRRSSRAASARPVQPGQLHRAGDAARPGQDLRDHRVRQVEVLPRRRRTRATSALTCRTS